MSTRNEVRSRLGRQGVLGLALEVRMNASGASETLSPAEREVSAQLLRDLVETWAPSVHARWARFDGAVKEVLLAAIAEHEALVEGDE